MSHTPGKTTCKCYIEHGAGDVEEITQCSLCAAAPELLAACKEALQTFQEMDAAYDTGDGDELPDIKRLKVVIAKADGHA